MRVFWVIVAVLVIVGVGIPVVRGIQARSHAEAAAQQAVAREVEARAQAERELAKAQVAAKVAEEKAANTAAEKAKAATPPPPAEAKPAEAKPPAAKPAETPPAVTQPVEPAPAKPEEPKATEVKPAAAPAEPSKAPKPAAPPTPPAAPTSGVAVPGPTVDATKATEAAGPKVVKRDDGTMLVDDKFVVKGEGTKEKPYEVSWDMLVSAQESYEPRQGKKKLPDRLTMLNDKYVKLTGYVAYPMFVEQPRELLSMLNQWDGCCIGVPPTPYDAVEVHLAEPVDKEQRAGIYGVVTGKFGVKPYLAGDWLVGLYLMENASYESKGFGGN